MMREAPAAEDEEKTLENWFEIIQKKIEGSHHHHSQKQIKINASFQHSITI